MHVSVGSQVDTTALLPPLGEAETKSHNFLWTDVSSLTLWHQQTRLPAVFYVGWIAHRAQLHSLVELKLQPR